VIDLAGVSNCHLNEAQFDCGGIVQLASTQCAAMCEARERPE
jgi:hypothetical protein